MSISNEANKMLLGMQRDSKLVSLICGKLGKMWRKLDDEDRAVFLEKCSGEEMESGSIPSACLLREFWISLCLGKGIERWTPKLRLILFTRGENKSIFDKTLNEMVINFENCIKDCTRSDKRTFAHLYRKVQRFVSARCPQENYGGGQWFGPKGLSKEEERLCCLDVAPSPLLDEIPLPDDAPSLPDFANDAKLRSEPIISLLRYYLGQVQARGLGKAVQIRHYCHWLSTHYPLVPGLSCIDGQEEDSDAESLQLADTQAPALADEAFARLAAEKIFEQMDGGQRKLCALWLSDCNLQEIADELGWKTPQNADAKLKRFRQRFFSPIVESMPEVAGDEETMELMHTELWLLCRNEIGA